MNNKVFLKKFIILSILLIFSDFVIGKIFEYLYFNQKSGKLYNLTVTLKEQECDALIFGSSRAMHHYDPSIISDSLQMSCYNAGYDAQKIIYHNAVLDVILQRYIPKLIILDVTFEEFNESEKSYDLLSVLLPYTKEYPVLWNTLELRSPFEKVKNLSHIYPYNSTLIRIIAGSVKRGGKDISENGFTPYDGVWEKEIEKYVAPEEKLDSNLIKAFDSFYAKCLSHKIALYIVFSPTYSINENNSASIDLIIKRSQELNIPFISYINNKNYTDNQLFLDSGHLNRYGASVFSKDIAHELLLYRNRQ